MGGSRGFHRHPAAEVPDRDSGRLLGEFLGRHDGSATREPVARTLRLRCLTPDGIDLAEAALYNGLARATLEASDTCRYAERAAREARRGIWKAETR